MFATKIEGPFVLKIGALDNRSIEDRCSRQTNHDYIHPYCVSPLPALLSNSRTVAAEQPLSSSETTIWTNSAAATLTLIHAHVNKPQ
jgi:hypothetical protein